MPDSVRSGDPVNPDVDVWYQGYEDWKGWQAGSFGVCSRAEASYFSAELRKAGVLACNGLRILEIGFGNGSFAGFARSQHAEYVGVEVNGALVARARTQGFNAIPAGEQLLPDGAKNGRQYDLMAAFDVIEHLVIGDIETLLHNARNVLRPGGILIARVPSGDSPFGRAVFYGDVTHRTILGSSAIRQLARAAGLEVVQIGAPALPVRGVGLVRAFRRLLVLGARKAVSGAINVIFHDGQPCVISSNLVFVLRKPRELM